MRGFISAKEAAAMVKDGWSMALGGFLGMSLPEDIYYELEKSYLETGHPAKLKLSSVAGLGGDGATRGYNRFSHPGMVGELRACNLTFCPEMKRLASENDFPCYMFPQGVQAHMMRAIAGKKPGVITQIGVKTFADPRVEGCKMNEAAKKLDKEVVKLLELDGNEYLYYPSYTFDCALIKGTSADENGNISIEHESLTVEQFEMACAAKNSGGIVIAQVDRVVQAGTLHPRSVIVPGAIVDYVVVGRPENSRQQYAYEQAYRPEMCGEVKIPMDAIEPAPMNIRKVIARRAAMELKKRDFVNLGVGIPTTVSAVLNEEGIANDVSFSIESGITGGVPTGGLATGGGINPICILKQPDTFDLYDGGGIDVGCLGAAEFDEDGNVNVSKFGGSVVGPGGFSNISQCAKTICFCGSFNVGKGEIEIKDGRLHIIKDTEGKKFHKKVEQITWSGEYCREKGVQKALFITERAVFEVRKEGVTLTEIAPGVDLQKDILDHMEFKPIIADDLKLMDERIFRDEPMGLQLQE